MKTSTNASFEDRHFRTLIERSTDAIQLVTPEGDVIFSSQSLKRVLGYTAEEVQGVNVGPYLHPDDAPEFNERLQKLLKKPLGHDTLEYRVKHKNGEWVWVETTITNHLETPGINALVGNFRNITERKQTEARLKDSEAQYRMLSDFSPQAITVHAEGKILYLNQAGARMIGAENSEDLIGQSIAKFVHPDYMDMVRQRVVEILKSKKPTPLVREKFVRLDGEVIDVEVISLPMTYDGKTAIQVVVRDITEQKKAQEAWDPLESTCRHASLSIL